MHPEVASSDDDTYVARSFILAFVGSFVALSAARRVVGPGGRRSRFDLLSATADRLAVPHGFGVIISTELPSVVMVMSVGLARVLSIDLITQ